MRGVGLCEEGVAHERQVGFGDDGNGEKRRFSRDEWGKRM